MADGPEDEPRKRPELDDPDDPDDPDERDERDESIEVVSCGKRVRRGMVWMVGAGELDDVDPVPVKLEPEDVLGVVAVRPVEIPPGNELRGDDTPRSPVTGTALPLEEVDEDGREVETMRELPDVERLGRETVREDEAELLGREALGRWVLGREALGRDVLGR